MIRKHLVTLISILFLLASQVQAGFAVEMINGQVNMSVHCQSMEQVAHAMSESEVNASVPCHAQMMDQDCKEMCETEHCSSSVGLMSDYSQHFQMITQTVLFPHTEKALLTRLESLQRPPKTA